MESLHYVFSEYVAIAPNTDVIFKDYAILIQGRTYFPDQFIRVLRNTDNGMQGNSIVDQNSMALNVGYSTLEYEKGLVKTGGNKKGFVRSARKLSQAAIDALKNAWKRLYQNTRKM